MAKRRDRPVENPLLRDRVDAIVGEALRVPSPPIQAKPEPVQGTSPKHKTIMPRKRGREEVHVKTRCTREEAEAMERFTRTLSAYLKTTVKGSEVTRALWTLALRAEERIAEVAHKAPSMDRPSYGDRMGRAEFEDAIAEFLQRVMR